MASAMWPQGMEGSLGGLDISQLLNASSGKDDKAYEWLMQALVSQRMSALAKAEEESRLAPQKAMAARNKLYTGIFNDIAKKYADPEKRQFMLDAKGKPLPDDIIQQMLQNEFKTRIKNMEDLGLLPQIQQPEQEVEEERPGYGSITVESDGPMMKQMKSEKVWMPNERGKQTNEGERGDWVWQQKEIDVPMPGVTSKYKKGAKAIQTPVGDQIIAEPIGGGKYKIKSRNYDKGQAKWLDRGTITEQDLGSFAFGEWYDPNKSKLSQRSQRTVDSITNEHTGEPTPPPSLAPKPKVSTREMSPTEESNAKNEALKTLARPGSVDLLKGNIFRPNVPVSEAMLTANPQPLTEAMKTLPRNKAMDDQLWKFLGALKPKYTPEPDLWE
jgi:hypothetical protein